MLQDYEISNLHTRTKRMGKVVAVVEFMLILFLIQSALMLFIQPQPEQAEEIRFRVVAHSNTPADQQLKESIQQAIAPLIHNAVSQATSNADIVDNLEEVDEEIYRIALQMADGQDVQFERKATLFPPKRSGLVITPQAPYDAYVLTIGSGRGDNWWCGLFPNVCFPEQETEKKADEEKEEKVTFFIWEWIKSLFS